MSFLSEISQICFGIYTNFLIFLFVMLFIEIIFRITQKEPLKAKPSFDRSDLDLDHSEKRPSRFSENHQIIKILSYLLIFAVLRIASLCLSFSQSEALNVPHPTITLEDSQEIQRLSEMIMMKNIDQEENHFAFPPRRVLEEVDDKVDLIPISVPSSPSKSSDKISLSMGNVLSSLNMDVTAMTLSKDRRTVFATLDYYGTLKIIDVSDLENPVVMSSLVLKVSAYTYRIKTLALSSDEKTLYISNSRDLEIIDVSDPGSPKLISFTPSEIFSDDDYFAITRFFRTSFALDEKTMTLFIGGLGLQIYDVSNPQNPLILKAERNDLDNSNLSRSPTLKRNEICLSHDGKFLFIANGTLDVYNISNPKEGLRLVTSLHTKSSPRSIFLHQDSKVALLLGTSPNDSRIILEEVDISDPKSPLIISTHNLDGKSTESPRILAVSPSKSKVYIFADEDYQGYELLVFDSLKNTTIKNKKSLIEKTRTMVFSPDGKILITGSNDQFMVIELFLEYPNKQIFSRTSLDVISNFSLPSSITHMKLSPDGNTLYLLRSSNGNTFDSIGIFEILNITDLNAPKVLFSFENTKILHSMVFTEDFNKVYLVDQRKISVFDISNKSFPTLQTTYSTKNPSQGFVQIVTTSDDKTGIITKYDFDSVYVTFFDLSETSEIREIFTLDAKFTTYNCRIVLINDKTLLILDKELLIYDISNIRGPKLLSSLPLGINEPEPYISSYLLSSDKKTLFIETYDQNEFNKLRIYNISEINSPKMISEKSLSKFGATYFKPRFSLSPDMKTGYVFQENSLVRVNLTDLKEPKVSGIIPLTRNSNGQRIYTVVDYETIRVLNVNIKYSLYLKQEKFMLGEKYSNHIAMLNLSGIADYNLMDPSAYKVIKLSLMDMKIAPNKYSLDVTTFLLPSWITFDRYNNFLMIEAKKQHDIGTYTFYSAFSLKIPETIFDGLGSKEKPVSSEDLIAWLISLDYVDNQLYLTGNFGALDTFYLPAQFGEYKIEIYNTLKKFFVETSTGFEIVPSLEFKTGENDLLISSLSTSSIKVEIRLEPRGGSEAKFLNRPYASILPAIKDSNKTQVSLEGFIKDINPALGSIVVNFENGKLCDATVTIIDGLNPAVTVSLKNISRYWKLNNVPMENEEHVKTVQAQIDQADIETGKYFAWALSEDTFTDENADILKYEIIAAKNGTAVPAWLSLSGLTLRGTPPEEVFGREIELILVAKNEFKQFGVPFKLSVKISSAFVFKLVLRYSPYILTLVGLLVSANKILNVVGKRFYKHPKEFFVNVGEEVSPEVIFPVAFIKEENDQSKLIIKQMRKKIPKREVSEYFVDPVSQALDQQKIVGKIQEAIREMPVDQREMINVKRIHLIEQIIMNKFVLEQLNSKREIKTKFLFDNLKTDCLEVIERRSSGFTIDTIKLQNLIKRIKGFSREASENLNESLMNNPEGVNMELLKDAILTYAFETHSLDILSVDVNISVKQMIKSGAFWKFLKLDLRDILNEKNKIDYGINCKIFDDKLYFYGTAENHFEDKKLVVQITTLRQKILKEIWIHGVSNQKGEVYLMKDEHAHDYEIF